MTMLDEFVRVLREWRESWVDVFTVDEPIGYELTDRAERAGSMSRHPAGKGRTA